MERHNPRNWARWLKAGALGRDVPTYTIRKGSAGSSGVAVFAALPAEGVVEFIATQLPQQWPMDSRTTRQWLEGIKFNTEYLLGHSFPHSVWVVRLP